MELKDYQQRALEQVSQYLEALAKEKKEGNTKHCSLDAWENIGKRKYIERKNGLSEDLPNFCLKIPTGGGKTFLAVKTIDLINTIYLGKRTGLVLWVVPTNQIYKQTLKSLRDREHPYRQHLDIASGGRTLILERNEHFSPMDVEENLVVLMLMLPAIGKQTKETLKVFRDNGGFQDFFPSEEKIEEHKKLLQKIPNLDVFSDENGFWGSQIKTSLGNTLRTLSPLIILDEGQKAYSDLAQSTLKGLNPSMIVELSATPLEKSNILVDIRGVELNIEEMIKLDLHIINKASPDWKDTLLESIEKRNFLEQKAKEYEANTAKYIRPICLIQAERMGKDQRGGKFIHAEDVREYLIKTAGIPAEQVAITSAEVKELEGHDLLSNVCPIRYIITKFALQEGWDCPFAYVLTILTNPTSKNSLTQLVGRILRQPYAKKTKMLELDESYVFTFQQRGTAILESIRKGFEKEGLGDLRGFISGDAGVEGEISQERELRIREKFARSAKEIILPIFVVKDGGKWRKVHYETDLAKNICWDEVNLKSFYNLNLSDIEEIDTEKTMGIGRGDSVVEQKEIKKLKNGGLHLDSVFLSRHLLDVVSNPWVSHLIGEKILSVLLKKYDESIVINNFVFIIEELRKYLMKEKDVLAEKVFREMLKEKELRFLVIGSDLGFKFPKKITVKNAPRPLMKSNGELLQRSLFDYIPEEELNEVEKLVALYLDDQDKLFFWYRNRARHDYAIQGWKKQKIYPDFLFAKDADKGKKNKVYVVETKGIHLKNEDTEYKESVFDVCNESAKEMDWNDLGLALEGRDIQFDVVFDEEWKNRFNEFFKK